MLRRTWSGDRAREARLAAGLKPDAVADATQTHRATVYGWEAGREPQMRHALALADLYRVPIDSFFVHDPDARTSGARQVTDRTESPANTDAPAAVVAGAENTGRRGGALTRS